jgi:hypothetical protein
VCKPPRVISPTPSAAMSEVGMAFTPRAPAPFSVWTPDGSVYSQKVVCNACAVASTLGGGLGGKAWPWSQVISIPFIERGALHVDSEQLD